MKVDDPGTNVTSAWFWDMYWHADRLAACFGADGNNYRPEIRRGWIEFFSQLPADATILDICTGNGAVALIAAELAKNSGKAFTIHAIDQADINPGHFVRSASPAIRDIHFHGNTPAEKPPFPACYFDAMCGQYALEYTRISDTIEAMCRLVKPGGRLRFVIHAAEGIVVHRARQLIDDTRVILEEIDFFDLARKLLTALSDVERAEFNPTQETYQYAIETRKTFQIALVKLRDRARQSTEQSMFENILGVITHALDNRRHLEREQILRKIDELEAKVRAHRARLEAMATSARTEAGVRALAAEFAYWSNAAFSVKPLRPAPQHQLVGWDVNVTVPLHPQRNI